MLTVFDHFTYETCIKFKTFFLLYHMVIEPRILLLFIIFKENSLCYLNLAALLKAVQIHGMKYTLMPN